MTILKKCITVENFSYLLSIKLDINNVPIYTNKQSIIFLYNSNFLFCYCTNSVKYFFISAINFL